MNAPTDRDTALIAGFLADTTHRRRRLQLVRALAAGSLAGGVVLAGTVVLDRVLVIDDSWRWLYAAGVWGSAALAAWRCGGASLLRPLSEGDIANLAEQRLPGLRDRLLAAHQLAGSGDGRDSPELRARLRADVAAALAGVDARSLLPLALLRGGLLAAGVAIGAHGALCLWPDLGWSRLIARSTAPWLGLDRVSTLRIRLLEPLGGDVVVPAGDAVAVVAELSAEPAAGAWIEVDGLRVPLEQRDDGRWAGQIPVGEQPLTFRLRAGDGLTAPHRLLPRPRPRATAISLRITPPAYSGLPTRTVEATRPEIVALIGSRVELVVAADQALASAELILVLDGGGSTLPLSASDGTHRGAFIVERNGTARLRLVAAETGFASAAGGDAEVRAIPDLVPTVVLHRPTGELVAPGDELLWLEGEAGDDVGLARVACEVRSGSGDWRELSSGVPSKAGAWPLREKLDLLALGAVPGDRIEARLVAIDRKGSRAESAVLAVTVADPGYPASRLAGAEAFEALTGLGLDAARRGEAATATAAAWTAAAEEGRQEELAHAAALAAMGRALESAGALVRSRLPTLRGGPADELQLCGRAARRLVDRVAQPERAKAAPATAAARAGCDEYAACLAALAAAEAAQVAMRDLLRLDRDQDDARVLAAGGGGERSQRRLAAAAVQAGAVGAMFERIAKRAPAAKGAVDAIAADLTAARADTARTTTAGAFEGAYFAGRAFNERKLVRGDTAIRFDSGQPIAPGLAWNEVSVRWLGAIKPAAAGQWTFITTSDDGVRLWLGGKLVIDNWTDHGPVEDRAVIASDGSPLELRLEYFQGGGGSQIQLDWQGPDGQRTAVAASGGGAQLAIAGFQQRLRGVQRTFVPVVADLLVAATDARRRLAVLAGDEASAIAAPAAEREAASAIAARLADQASFEESRADADTQAVSDLAQAATALTGLPESAERTQLAADVAAVAAEAQAERAVQAAVRAAAAATPLAAAEELLRSRPRDGSAAAKAANDLLAAAKSGRELDQGLREELAAARAEAEAGQTTAQQAGTAARQRLGDDTPRLAARLSELAKEAAATARSAAADPTAAMAEAHRLAEAIEAAQRDLHRDANRHDGGDAAERARARDADGAAALLAQPPPRAEELLRRAAAATDPHVKSEALAQAAQQQAELAADLALAGRHWQALAEGKDPAPTRRELRRREAEAGLADKLDAAAAERDRLAALAEADAARAEAGLAEALKDDAEMRRELERLSAAEAEAAQLAAEAAASREQAMATQAKAAAEARAASAQAAKEAEAGLDARMRELAQAVRNQSERSAAAPEARPKLDSAATALDRAAAAPEPTASAQAAQAAAAELNAAAERLDAAAAPVQQALDQRKVEEAAAASRRDAARNAADAAKAQAATAEQNAAAAQAAAEAAQRAREAAQSASERAAAAAATPPVGSDPAAAAAAQAAAERAATVAQQAGDTEAQAKAHVEQAAAGAEQTRNAAAATAAQQASAQAAAEQAAQARSQAQAAMDAQPRGGDAREQAKRAADLAAQAQAAAATAAAQRASEQGEDAELASGQRSATSEAATAAAQAARAARHQQRLGNDPAGLAASAAQLAAAERQAAMLGERLAAGEQPAGDLAANAQALADAAKAMGEAASGQQPAASQAQGEAEGQGQSAPSERDSATSRAMARALDRIDAGVAPSQALAEARDALGQSRSAARRESRGTTPPGEGGTNEREPGSSGQAVTAERPLDWGRLPKELARELLEGDREAVPEEYRRQVDGYFRAIGERAQEPR